jgi:monoterpene epsilon-lactone hydrolase
MGLLRFVLSVWVSFITVAWSRWRRGPLRPTWSFGFEVITRAQKRFNRIVSSRPPAEQRKLWGALEAKSPALRQVKIREQTLAGVPVLWFESTASDGGPVVLYLHGGSFIYGSEKSHGDLMARLAIASGARIVFPLYRLAPEHPFPAALEDSRAVYDALLERKQDPSRLIVAGDSAGGNLVVSLLVALRDAGAPLPRAAIPISPWLDLSAPAQSLERNAVFDWAGPWMFDLWASAYLARGETRTRPDVSPMFADLERLPPLMLVFGNAEMLFDQCSAFARRARRAGVEVTEHIGADMVHLWMALAPMFPNCQTAIDEMGAFVKSACATRPNVTAP